MLKKIIRKLNPFSNLASEELIGIDFGGSSLKLAYLKVSGSKIEIVNLLSRDIKAVPEEHLAIVVKEAFNSLKVKSAKILNTIPAHFAITKNIEIPSTDHDEIRGIINLQASRHTPYSREEIVVDYMDLGTYKNNYSKILLLIISRKVIKRQFQILQNAQIPLEKMGFTGEGLSLSVSKILNLKNQDKPVNIIHIDEDFTDFAVIFKNKLLFIRSIPIGSEHLFEERARYESRFTEELRTSLEAYQSENIEGIPNSFILTGAIEGLSDLAGVLQANLNLPIRIMPYFDNLIISEDVKKNAALSKRVSFLDLIANLLSWEELKVDLIPEEVKLRKAVEDRGKEMIKTGIFVLAIFVLIFSILISKIYFKTVFLKKIDSNYQSLNREAIKLERDFEKISFIKNYLSKRGHSLEALIELHASVPLGLQINDIRFEETRFSVRGTAESMAVVFNFVENMGNSKYFNEVKTKYTTKRKEGQADVTDFEITSLLNKKTGQ